GKPEVILIGSGSELSLCVNAHEELLAEGIRSRVVSMPSWEIFEHQPQAYQDSILLPDVTVRVAVEQASTFGWERYVGKSGRVIGMKTFGASAALKALQRKFGFEPERVTEIAKELLGKDKTTRIGRSALLPSCGVHPRECDVKTARYRFPFRRR